ncbi:hypothetical protein L227DRAFT_405861 [Lentinus tigrinus ALCF2SS1-6]|uniref:Uncharacterized protein n=1 Tax=Lentinus tigrinus ALCF2SS1-6 TaxID=1328759 RepID=A0A5C2RPT4_9APHY|nr:hypothetical protein L227DRAFT_405861 [Lentinus tigrinus ALCF2SS1-6]
MEGGCVFGGGGGRTRGGGEFGRTRCESISGWPSTGLVGADEADMYAAWGAGRKGGRGRREALRRTAGRGQMPRRRIRGVWEEGAVQAGRRSGLSVRGGACHRNKRN